MPGSSTIGSSTKKMLSTLALNRAAITTEALFDTFQVPAFRIFQNIEASDFAYPNCNTATEINAWKTRLDEKFSDPNNVLNGQCNIALLRINLAKILKSDITEDIVRILFVDRLTPLLAFLAYHDKDQVFEEMIKLNFFNEAQPFNKAYYGVSPIIVATVLAAKKFISQAFKLALFDEHDAALAMTIAIKQENFDMIKFLAKYFVNFEHWALTARDQQCSPEIIHFFCDKVREQRALESDPLDIALGFNFGHDIVEDSPTRPRFSL